MDAQPHLLVIREQSRPSSPSSDSGTLFSLQIFDHISDALPQWLSSDISNHTNLLGPGPESSLRNVKASARSRHIETRQLTKSHRDRISTDPNLDAWGLKPTSKNDCVEGVWETLNPYPV